MATPDDLEFALRFAVYSTDDGRLTNAEDIAERLRLMKGRTDAGETIREILWSDEVSAMLTPEEIQEYRDWVT